MKLLVWNMVLALLWGLLLGRVDGPNLFAGYLLGYLALFLGRRMWEPSSYFSKPMAFLRFLVFFAREMALSQYQVAHDILTPDHQSKPGNIAFPLDARTDLEIALFACLLTLTPGTVSLEVSADRRTLFIHCMFMPPEGPDALRRNLKEGLERRLLELLR